MLKHAHVTFSKKNLDFYEEIDSIAKNQPKKHQFTAILIEMAKLGLAAHKSGFALINGELVKIEKA